MNKESKILITGGNGVFGRFLTENFKFSGYKNIFAFGRDQLDVLNRDNVQSVIKSIEPNIIIHCAIKGGRRTEKDDPKIVYENLLGFENIFNSWLKYTPYGTFVNFASGAEFDTRFNIDVDDYSNFYSVPIDYYGFSKYLITNKLRDWQDFDSSPLGAVFNLRSFNTFSQFEENNRFITTCIKKSTINEPINIPNDKYFTFFSGFDLFRLLEYLFKNTYSGILEEINLTYNDKNKLSDIAKIIIELNKSKSIINIGQLDKKSYLGSSNFIEKNKNELVLDGLEVGLKEMINLIK